MTDKIDALIKVLEMYAETDKPVTQNFYQGLCIKAKEYLEQLQAENKRLRKEIGKQKNKTVGKCINHRGEKIDVAKGSFLDGVRFDY